MRSTSLAETPSHFFKIILPQTLEDEKLSIPEKFVRKFGDELSAVATLRVSNGCVWHVGLTKDGRRMWFNDGWHEFVMYHSVCVGYFLVFRYEGNSNFHVLIFDTTACEIAYPSNGEKDENDKQKYRVCDSCPMSNGEMHTPLSQQNQQAKASSFDSTRGIKRLRACVAASKSPKFKHNSGHESRRKKCNMEEVVEMDESCHGKLNINEMCNSVGPLSRNAKTKFGGDDNQTEKIAAAEPEFLVSLQDMGIYVARNFGFVSEIEKERAINITRSFKSKNPSFMAIIRSRNIHKSSLYVPAKFSDKFLSRDFKHLIKLEDSDGTEWPVQMNGRPYGGSDFTKGWSTFAKEKKLNNGDILVFELIKKEEDILFRVSLFHSTMELGTNN